MAGQTLRDLTTDRLELMEMLDDDELPDGAVLNTLAGVDGAIGDKLDSIAGLIAHWSASDAGMKAEIARLQGRRSVYANRVRRLKAYVHFQLCRLNEQRIETDLFTFRIQRGAESVVVDDLDLVPPDLVKVERSASKSGIKDRLKAGEEIPGAHLERGADFVVIR